MSAGGGECSCDGEVGSEDGGGGRPVAGQYINNSDIKLVHSQQGKVISVIKLMIKELKKHQEVMTQKGLI